LESFIERYPWSQHLPQAVFSLGTLRRSRGDLEGAASAFWAFLRGPDSNGWRPQGAALLGSVLCALGNSEEFDQLRTLVQADESLARSQVSRAGQPWILQDLLAQMKVRPNRRRTEDRPLNQWSHPTERLPLISPTTIPPRAGDIRLAPPPFSDEPPILHRHPALDPAIA
jgi:hypothetical protein